MHLMYFTEQPMSAYDAKEGLKYGATALTFSNKHFDPVAGSRLYNEYLEQYIYAEESRHRRHHAERAPQRAVLHAGQGQHIRRRPGRRHQARQDRACSAIRCRWPRTRSGSPRSWP